MNTINLEQSAVSPSKVVCIGRNYVAHIEELNNEMPKQPVIFMKPNSAIADEIYSSQTDDIHYEGEITFLVRSGKLYGVGFGLDLTKRDIQSALKAKGLPWERAKAFDNSAVFSDFVHFNCPLQDLRMELSINDVLIQNADYPLMINKPQAIVEEVSQFLTLEDNDLIMTGTPKGVGQIHAGDTFKGTIFAADDTLVTTNWTVK